MGSSVALAAVHSGTGDDRTGAHSSLFSVASLVSHRTLHSVSSTSVARVGAYPSSVARVRASGSLLCCACCGLARVAGGRTLCGSCLLEGRVEGDIHNSCLEHGHEVVGETKPKSTRTLSGVWATTRRFDASWGRTGIRSSSPVRRSACRDAGG